ncbi:MAG: TatD family hydrolase [Candidatus Kapabacteria bacterium]|jgi:TatD DNase family protein|nr:TatD family hydrolase [Candidatus Kapabacteria bacterium]
MIDTHAHLDFEAFDEDRDGLVERAKEAGINKIIIPGVDPKDFDRLIDTANKYENVYCGIGIHPHNAAEVDSDLLRKVSEYSAESKVVAVGEIGLDYYYDFCPKDKQQEVFREQLRIAKNRDLPIIVHNREADEDVLRILEEEKDERLRGVLHCFSSDTATMRRAVELGFHVSFTGNITFKKSTLADVVREVPMDRVMIETDSPFMTPVPNRGKRNEPAYVKLVAEKIAEIKSLSIDEVIKMTTLTAEKLFKFAVFVLFFAFAANVSFAQINEVQPDSSVIDTEYLDEEYVPENPNEKLLGFGVIIGTNTAIDTYIYPNGDDTDISYEGMLAPGFGLYYSPLDFLILETTYIYSKNQKIVQIDDFGNVLVDPSIYHIFNLSSRWIVNPYSKINFFATGGVTFFHNSINNVINDEIGWNAGIGAIINIPIKGGLLDVILEWKLDFESEEKDAILYKRIDGDWNKLDLKRSSWYSIPRLTVIYFPYL